MIKLGLIGCGAIGEAVVKAIRHGVFPEDAGVVISVVYDINSDRVDYMSNEYGVDKAQDIPSVFAGSDIVLECAAVSAVAGVLKAAIGAKKDVIILSVGGLLNETALLQKAREAGIRVIVPSGAICCIDAVKSAGFMGGESVLITTYKPPKGFAGNPYLSKKGIRIEDIEDKTVIFEGDVFEAVKNFPKNINVAATVYLAAGTRADVRVKLVADPAIERNVHQLEIIGQFSGIKAIIENLPSEDNPKTSFMTVLSTLRRLYDHTQKGLCVGT